MPTKRLLELTSTNNICDLLDEEELKEISCKVFDGLEEDKLSRKDWVRTADEVMELTLLKHEPKNHPWPGASSVKYPLVTTAMVQFSARIIDELIKNGKIVKHEVLGSDLDNKKFRKGERLAKYLNWQLLRKMKGYRTDKSRLVNQLSVVGTCLTKCYFDEVDKTVKSKLVPYDMLVINDYIESLEKAPRITEYIYMTKNQVVEHIRSGLFRTLDRENDTGFLNTIKNRADEDKKISTSTAKEILTTERVSSDYSSTDRSNLEFIEQHCWLDLDYDGYEEPYIVVAHVTSKEIMRIVARFREPQDVDYMKGDRGKEDKVRKIYPINFYQDYHLIPSPNGRFYSLGLGTLLLNSNKMINSLMNQLIDAGTLCNTKTFLHGKSLRMRRGQYQLIPGQGQEVDNQYGEDIGKSIFMFDFKEPSPVLLQMLQVLIEASKTLTSTTESLTGTTETQNVSPNTLLASIQQGLVTINDVAHRFFEAQEGEINQLVLLDSIHVNVKEYLKIQGIPETIQQQNPQTGQPQEVPNPEFMEMFQGKSGKFSDFEIDDVDICPVADINSSTKQERLLRAQSSAQFAQQLPGSTNVQQVALEFYTALGYENPQRFVAPPAPPPPDPKMVKIQADQQANQAKLQASQQVEGAKLQIEQQRSQQEFNIKQAELKIKAAEVQAKAGHMKSQSVKNMADAEAAVAGKQLEAYKQQTDSLYKAVDAQIGLKAVQNEADAIKQKAADTNKGDN